MISKRLLLPGILLIAIAAVLSACAASPQAPTADDPTAVAAAVEATLTAIAASGQDNTPTATPTPPDTSAQAPVILPPLVDGFDPAPRPASSKGDPNAPVVIYEWSDYT